MLGLFRDRVRPRGCGSRCRGRRVQPAAKGAGLGALAAPESVGLCCGDASGSRRAVPGFCLVFGAWKGFACWMPDVDGYRKNHLDSRGGTRSMPGKMAFQPPTPIPYTGFCF